MRRTLLLAVAILGGLLPIAIISSVFAYDFETLAEPGGIAASYRANTAVSMLARTNGAVIESDDFNYCSLNTALWTYTDPDGDATLNLNGQQLSISLPAGTTHEIWESGGNFSNNVPRIMQPADNTDFEIEIKFDTQFSPTLPGGEFQMQGVLIEEDADDVLRLEFYRRSSETRIFAATFVDGEVTVRQNSVITESSPIYMRVTRVSDNWTQSFSDDGLDWTAIPSFNHPITVTAVGAYAGNSGASNEVLIDYFYNNANRGPGDVDQITLDAIVSPIGSGTVAKNPDQATYQCSDEVELTATPNQGWSFSSWSGDLSSSTNPDTITINSDKTVTATFTADTYELTVNKVGNGSVFIDPDGPYTFDQMATLTATANLGWSFAGWSGDLSGSTNPDTITMNSDKTVTATFTADTYELTLNKVGNGSVFIDPDGPYTFDQMATLTATANQGWTFTGWSGDLSGSTNPDTITMNNDKTVTATFTADTYELTVNNMGNGSVLTEPEGPYTYGQVVTLTATADLHWTFAGWSGDLSGSTNPTSITMNSDKTVTAKFKQYTLFLPIILGGRPPSP